MIESILIATDGSDAAHVAERFGAALAGRLRARCYGLTVIEERVTSACAPIPSGFRRGRSMRRRPS
jgi:nucleotide-binding universal stress UspA family protein